MYSLKINNLTTNEIKKGSPHGEFSQWCNSYKYLIFSISKWVHDAMKCLYCHKIIQHGKNCPPGQPGVGGQGWEIYDLVYDFNFYPQKTDSDRQYQICPFGSILRT